MGILIEPNNWKDQGNATPPVWWEALAADDRYWFSSDSPFGGVTVNVTYLRSKALDQYFAGSTDGSGAYGPDVLQTLVTPGTVLITVGDFGEEFTDAAGVLTGDSGGTGTINYTTGEFSFSSPSQPNADVVVTFRYEDDAYEALPSSLVFTWEVTEPSVNGGFAFHYRTEYNGTVTDVTIPNEIGSGEISVEIPDGNYGYFSWLVDNGGGDRLYTGIIAIGEGESAMDFNCDCTDPIGESYKTLAQLRRRMMIRLGFAVQADSPPPGMAILIDDFLQSAQTLLMEKHRELRTARFFTWEMTPGQRLYGIWDNVDECPKKLDPLKLKWVGIEDQGTSQEPDSPGTWLPLVSGIRPEYYTTVTSWGMPSCYEIRQCIEVFPAPDRAYKLRVKADFYAEAFVADSDKTSINSELVFLWALSDAKAHYGKPDAGNIRAAAVAFLGDLKAGRHGTARYVPGASVLPNVARPLFLPLVGE